MKKILDTIFSDNAEFVVRFLFAVIVMAFFTSNLFSQDAYMTPDEYDKAVQRQEQKENQQRHEESMIKQQQRYRKQQKDEKLKRMRMLDEKKRGQQQIKRIIMTKEKKRKFMKRKIRRERIKTFIIGIGIGYAIGGK